MLLSEPSTPCETRQQSAAPYQGPPPSPATITYFGMWLSSSDLPENIPATVLSHDRL
jgi:hypothetical protein